MSEQLKNTINALTLHRMVIVWVCLFSVNAFCASIMTALAGTQWSDVDNQTRFLIVISVLATWTNTMAAFFNQAIARAKEGQDIVSTGDTNSPLKKP